VKRETGRRQLALFSLLPRRAVRRAALSSSRREAPLPVVSWDACPLVLASVTESVDGSGRAAGERPGTQASAGGAQRRRPASEERRARESKDREGEE